MRHQQPMMCLHSTDSTAPVPEATTIAYPVEPHHWVPAMVYTRPDLLYMSWPPDWPGRNTYIYTKEYIDACDRESSWVQIEPTPALDPEWTSPLKSA